MPSDMNESGQEKAPILRKIRSMESAKGKGHD